MKMIYSEKQLPQKSDEWIKFRVSGIGGSDLNIIMGNFPKFWTSDYDLFLFKMGKPQVFKTNKYIEDGNKYEDIARKYIEDYLNKGYKNESYSEFEYISDKTDLKIDSKVKFDQITAKYKKDNPIFSSFDGVDKKNKLILELKCPTDNTHLKIVNKPVVPKTYQAQIQSQLLVANERWGIDQGIFANFHVDGVKHTHRSKTIQELVKLVLVPTKLDLDYCKLMINKCEDFYKMVQQRKWNKNWNNDE